MNKKAAALFGVLLLSAGISLAGCSKKEEAPVPPPAATQPAPPAAQPAQPPAGGQQQAQPPAGGGQQQTPAKQ